MLQTIEKLNSIIEAQYVRLRLIPESTWSAKPVPNKWSKKEILGHLIDSAHNNLRRVIITQYSPEEKIVYNQDFWVTAQNYQQSKTEDLIELWKLMNRRLTNAFKHVSSEKYHFVTDVGTAQNEYLTIDQLLDMYIDHLQHHLKQITS